MSGLQLLLEGLPHPTDEEVVAIADHDHRCARLLVRSRALASQASLAVNAMATQVTLAD